jgi:hypothetical protein
MSGPTVSQTMCDPFEAIRRAGLDRLSAEQRRGPTGAPQAAVDAVVRLSAL